MKLMFTQIKPSKVNKVKGPWVDTERETFCQIYFCPYLQLAITDTAFPMRELASTCMYSTFAPELYSFTNVVKFVVGITQPRSPYYLNLSFVAVPETERPGLEILHVTRSMGK